MRLLSIFRREEQPPARDAMLRVRVDSQTFDGWKLAATLEAIDEGRPVTVSGMARDLLNKHASFVLGHAKQVGLIRWDGRFKQYRLVDPATGKWAGE